MNERMVGTSAFGIRAGIVKQGDDIVEFVSGSLFKALENDNLNLKDKDIIGITESLVARAQGNFANLEDIGIDLRSKYPNGEMGIVFPITSRNRFSLLLKACSKAMKKVYILLSLPSDEFGNQLISEEKLEDSGINLYQEILSEEEYYSSFGRNNVHRFTGLDYVKFYKSLGNNIEILFSNNPCNILKYTKDIFVASVHNRESIKNRIKSAGANIVFGQDDILKESINGSGYNQEYGVLGSNMSTDNSIKLFPRDCYAVVDKIQKKIKDKTGKLVEVMVYGDGCFKDPVGGVWELADPVVSPGYTKGLEGSPDELKLKYLADNQFSDSPCKEEDIKKAIESKKSGSNNSLGTTPRRYVDLVGSLCDLTSGSGEKGTPIILIQGYFDSYADK